MTRRLLKMKISFNHIYRNRAISGKDLIFLPWWKSSKICLNVLIVLVFAAITPNIFIRNLQQKVNSSTKKGVSFCRNVRLNYSFLRVSLLRNWGSVCSVISSFGFCCHITHSISLEIYNKKLLQVLKKGSAVMSGSPNPFQGSVCS
jgi:hypothetical protein